MSVSIAVHNRQRAIRINIAELQSFAEAALPLAVKSQSRAVSRAWKLSHVDVILISDRKMSELHRRFLQLKGPTDVITFQHGEIFISVETTRRQARAFGTSLPHELRLYLVHGLLHLRGFNDNIPAEARTMRATQERIAGAATTAFRRR